MLCVSQDHSLSADAVHLVFLEMSESLDWSAMTCSSFAGIYFGFCLTVFRSVQILKQDGHFGTVSFHVSCCYSGKILGAESETGC